MPNNTEHTEIRQGGTPVAFRNARTLLGWLEREKAIRMLLGHDPESEEDISDAAELYDACKHAVSKRKPHKPVQSIVKPPMSGWDIETRAQDPTLQASLSGLDWSLQFVDLTKIIAYQHTITTDGLNDRIAPILADRSNLYEFCLPGDLEIPPNDLLRDGDHKGFTVSSVNPNLRIAGNETRSVKVAVADGLPPMPMLSITFLLSMGTNYIKVGSYQGRDFLRDGYHRAAALLQHGIKVVPCVYIAARNLEEIGGNRTFALNYDILFGDRPPFLSDFWDDKVSSEVQQLALRRVVRVSAKEFDVQG